MAQKPCPVNFPMEMTNKYLTKGTGFSLEEREKYKLTGLMPVNVETLDEQAARAIAHVRSFKKMLNKYIYMENLHSQNVKLFYKVLLDNVVELLPVLYTPTVGEACQKYGSIFRNFAGLYLSALERGRFAEVLDNWYEEPEIIVVTDGGRILGLGDQGAGGMGIPIGKLHLYCAGGGFRPSNTLPIQLDVGCDTKQVVEDPFYLGHRMPRVHGAEHEAFCDEFMAAVADKWPKCIIQFEDFQSEYALKYLERYRTKYIHFNDDVQGTAAIVTSGFINGMKAQGTELKDARVVMFGAGSSAVGVCTYLCNAMVAKGGLTFEEAKKRIYMIDSKGLITTTRGDKLNEWKSKFARNDGTAECPTLLDAIKLAKPNALFGLTGAGPVWKKEDIEALVAGCGGNGKPLIFPLSNPTSKAEVSIQQAVEWSKGRLLFASGSPFPAQEYEGKPVFASQCNNMFIFPGVGMGAKLSASTQITDSMLLAAAFVVADFVNADDIKRGKLYPDLHFLRHIGKWITKAVWDEAQKEGVAQIPPPTDVRRYIKDSFYDPEYCNCN
uniref:Malic enzyme n=1 Tax=Pyramimonas obovata TaxID=1411642 RepID=A0A7S0MXS7_9CHLO